MLPFGLTTDVSAGALAAGTGALNGVAKAADGLGAGTGFSGELSAFTDGASQADGHGPGGQAATGLLPTAPTDGLGATDVLSQFETALESMPGLSGTGIPATGASEGPVDPLSGIPAQAVDPALPVDLPIKTDTTADQSDDGAESAPVDPFVQEPVIAAPAFTDGPVQGAGVPGRFGGEPSAGQSKLPGAVPAGAPVIPLSDASEPVLPGQAGPLSGGSAGALPAAGTSGPGPVLPVDPAADLAAEPGGTLRIDPQVAAERRWQSDLPPAHRAPAAQFGQTQQPADQTATLQTAGPVSPPSAATGTSPIPGPGLELAALPTQAQASQPVSVDAAAPVPGSGQGALPATPTDAALQSLETVAQTSAPVPLKPTGTGRPAEPAGPAEPALPFSAVKEQPAAPGGDGAGRGSAFLGQDTVNGPGVTGTLNPPTAAGTGETANRITIPSAAHAAPIAAAVFSSQSDGSDTAVPLGDGGLTGDLGTGLRAGEFSTSLRTESLQLPNQAQAGQVATQVAAEIARNLKNGMTRFQMRFDPPELGRVEVTMRVSPDGSVQAHLIVERPETLDMFLRDQRGLERALEAAGLKTDSQNLEFSLKQDGGREFASGDGDAGTGREGTDPVQTGEPDADPTVEEVLRLRLAEQRGGLDLRI